MTDSLDDIFPRDRAWEYENGFYLTSSISRLGKLVAQYEIYRQIVDLPGQVVELGVYKGASLVRLATFRELLESPWSRKIIAFDAFGEFPRDNLDTHDRDFVNRFEQQGGDGLSERLIREVLDNKSLRNIELVSGDITSTIDNYLALHPELRIALLHLDIDVHEPTGIALDRLAPRVVPGGLIVVDDYGTVAGATRALDEYFANRSVSFKKLPVSHIPTYIVRDW